MKITLNTIISTLLLSGCASTSIVEPARMASSDEAVFVVIRKNYPPTAWTGDLSINDKIVATMKENTYVKVNVPTGKAAIALKFAPMLGFSNAPFFMEVGPNETRYILLTGDVVPAGIDHLGLKVKWSLNAFEISEKSAAELIEKLPKP